MVKINKRTQLTCKRCGYIWVSSILPKVCPKCHLNWRYGKKVKIAGTKKHNLNYLDNLKKHYGENATVEDVLEDIKRREVEK